MNLITTIVKEIQTEPVAKSYPDQPAVNPATEKVLGTVPAHLQPLYAYYVRIAGEHTALLNKCAGKYTLEQDAELALLHDKYEIAYTAFFFEINAAFKSWNYQSIGIRQGFTVVAVSHSTESNLAEILRRFTK